MQDNIFNPKEMRVLLVDDIQANIDVLNKTLMPEGYRTSFAPNGKAALKITAHDIPDLILLDVMMPEMDGFETCSLLKSNDRTRDIPIVFITAKTETKDIVKGFQLGIVDYITKPFQREEVLARVRTHLENRILIKKLKEANIKLEHLTLRDELTGISNRRHFNNILQNELRRSKRYNKPLSLLIIDIDYFKKYNDHYGHHEGDVCLKIVAQTLDHMVNRAGDIVARYGGEEFAIVLSETTIQEAGAVAERCRDAVEALTIKHKDSEVSNHVTISIGVATAADNDIANYKNLIEKADKLLYIAKKRGKNMVVAEEMK